MENNKEILISVCLVVYNEDKIIERCLNSIKDLADEIVLIHDGECNDKTLEIAKKFTDRIFIQPRTGDSSLHRVFSYNEARGRWIFQIDADEFIDQDAQPIIRNKIIEAEKKGINGFSFQWEMWDGKKAYAVKGFKKDCLFKKENFHYLGVTHGWAYIDGKVEDSGLVLHHRPAYDNLSWESFFRKAKRWVPIHAKFYFPNQVTYTGFNIGPEKWIKFTEKVKKNMIYYVIFEPIKMSLGQLKNGLYLAFAGWQVAAQQYVYYTMLYWQVWKIKRKSK